MTPSNEMVSTPSLTTERGPISINRLSAIALGTLLFFGVVAVAAVSVGQRAEIPTTTTQAAGEVTDGWLSAITYANRAQATEAASQTVDGWSSYLLRAEPPVVDGWASALLKPEPRVMDGWASRYLVDDQD